ncbi:methionyl-tRNA formyltransferase [Elusimicrobiota bacterium]
MKKESYIIATIKPWNIEKAMELMKKNKRSDIHLITDKKDLLYPAVKKINPRYIFFPHWSWIIPKNIYENYECVVFHMTDLPFGRGGSPLQNLIVRGIKHTKITAIKVTGGIDAGPVYMKESLQLGGAAAGIFKRFSLIVFDKMIPYMLDNNPSPVPQKGRIVKFKRRNPSQSDIGKIRDIEKIYDHIRMLDAQSYPRAYLQKGNIRYEFTKARFHGNSIKAQVIIEVKDE